ncbi:SPW repeat domain-containing protein [Pseudonocardia acaciae]|uniref:SPW repeat domain-containing protein n=1 Tax=Pseudonocardia acaciae TaxID=551276 RepID=UPI0006865333|nr:SPW repeat protein [Pseudonocardia acaciae]
MRATRWLDWTNLLLGLYVLFVPLFTLDSENGSTIWTAEVLGAVVALTAIWALAQPASAAAEWTLASAGVLLLIAPFVLSYTHLTGAAWNAYVVGAVVAVLALSALPSVKRLGGGSSSGAGRTYPTREHI